MTKDPRKEPRLGERGARELAERKERLAAALRENLRKRKQQARGRAEAPLAPCEPDKK